METIVISFPTIGLAWCCLQYKNTRNWIFTINTATFRKASAECGNKKWKNTL